MKTLHESRLIVSQNTFFNYLESVYQNENSKMARRQSRGAWIVFGRSLGQRFEGIARVIRETRLQDDPGKEEENWSDQIKIAIAANTQRGGLWLVDLTAFEVCQ